VKTSLIINVFNRLDMLEVCLRTISRQRVMPDEIVLSDDGSEEDIVGFFQAQRQKLAVPMKLIRQKHNGFRLSRVRNNAVKHCSHELLIFVDQDIIIPPSYIQYIHKKKRPQNFLSSYPVRLSETQSMPFYQPEADLTGLLSAVSRRQLKEIHYKYRKEFMENLMVRYLGLGVHGAKLRGGVAVINRDDYIKVNGFDENFIGWGGEDDDLGRRLLAIGKAGYNFAYHCFPVHLYHPPYHGNKPSPNDPYTTLRKKLINPRNYRCEVGYDAPRDDLEVYGA